MITRLIRRARLGTFLTVTAMFVLTMGASAESDTGGQTLAANSIELHYHVHGSGEPLLLLHGGLGHSAGWHGQIAAFAEHFKVITMDSRGHGRSTFDAAPISYAVMATDVLTLLDHLGIERVHVVGWSDGGIIGLELAIHHPERLGKLVAYGANYSPAGVRTDIGDNERFNQFIAAASADYQQVSPAAAHWQEFLDNIGRMWANEPHYSDAQMGAISSPVLVFGGEQEEAIYVEHIRATAQLIPHAELVLMPDTGHFAHWEQPAEFNRVVLEFLH